MSHSPLSLSRRSLLRAGTAVVAGGLAAPLIARHALASSGELNFMGWAGYDAFPAIFAAFEKKTGIKVNFTGFGSQDEMVAQAKTGAGTNGAFDISEPTSDRIDSWTDNGFLQPWDESKINLNGLEPSFLSGRAKDMTARGGKRVAVPSVWGTESLLFNTQEAPETANVSSYMDMFDDKYAGKLTVRGHSGLAAIGLGLEGQGKLPHKYAESYVDQTKMTENYDVILKYAQTKRANVAQFWSNENEAQGAFRTNGCVIGTCWDTSAQALLKEGLPVGYVAPKEGALAWLQNFVLLKGAKNVEQANAWVAWINSPEGGAQWAAAYGANPTAVGAIDMASADAKKFFQAAYPGDALKTLFWWPPAQSWFIEKRTEYAKKFMSA